MCVVDLCGTVGVASQSSVRSAQVTQHCQVGRQCHVDAAHGFVM